MHISQIKPGDTLIADDGFDCLEHGQSVVVEADGDYLFVPCKCGRHGLDGQLDFGGNGNLVGLYSAVEFKAMQTGAST
jgi:hypothetical protein